MMRLVRLPILLSFASLGAACLYVAESIPTSTEAVALDLKSLKHSRTHETRNRAHLISETTVAANQLRAFLDSRAPLPADREFQVAQAEIDVVKGDKSDRSDFIKISPAGAKPDSQADPEEDLLVSDDEPAGQETAELTTGKGDLLEGGAELDEEELSSDEDDGDLDEEELVSDEDDGELDEEELVSDEDDGELDEEELASDESDGELDEEQLEGEGDLLDAAVDEDEEEAETQEASVETDEDGKVLSADEEHLNLFLENRYPSATTCGTCHPKHFDEWSVSQHAYAQLSPVYLSLNNRINELSNGSNGDFCLRCHSPVGANLGESSFASNLDRHPASREGITCVVCHRINRSYNKASGRLALEEGGLTEAIYGPTGNHGLQEVLDDTENFRVVTDPDESGRQIHGEAKLFNMISTPTFCGTCHDVTLFNGFRLEEAFSEYRLSPAAAKGITCQDCHMGKVQGKPMGYDEGPAAVVGEVPTKTRKITSHLFSGPDYSLIHPGIFPHSQEAQEFKTLRQWLEFKHEEGWGTDEFEDNAPENYKFPETWVSIDDRYDARKILQKQFAKLEVARVKRLEVLQNGFLLADVVSERADRNGISFRVKVANGTDGHNVPTGFTGERVVWLDVTVTDAEGTEVFRSGDRDPNGDLRDGHSSYVHAGTAKRDKQLFSLQSTFVVQNGRGGEMEQVIPIPYPSFALPRVLPSVASLVFTGEPATERNHKKSIEPLGERWASYKVDGDVLTGKGPYKATIKLNAQAVPVNLLIAMQGVGFDYNMTPRELGDALIAGAQTLWEKELVFDIEAPIVPVAGDVETAPQGPISIIPVQRESKNEVEIK